MNVQELPQKFPDHFWGKEGKVYTHRYTGGQSIGSNYGEPVEVEITEAGKPEKVRVMNRDIATNVYYQHIQVFTPTEGTWPGGYFSVYLSKVETENGEPYKEWW